MHTHSYKKMDVNLQKGEPELNQLNTKRIPKRTWPSMMQNSKMPQELGTPFNTDIPLEI